MLVVGPPVNVDDIARGMLHGLRLCWRPDCAGLQRKGRNSADVVQAGPGAAGWLTGRSAADNGEAQEAWAKHGDGTRACAVGLRCNLKRRQRRVEARQRRDQGWTAPARPAGAREAVRECLRRTRQAQRADATGEGGERRGRKQRRREGAAGQRRRCAEESAAVSWAGATQAGGRGMALQCCLRSALDTERSSEGPSKGRVDSSVSVASSALAELAAR